MVQKVLIGVLVVAGLFLVYALLSKTANAAELSIKQRRDIDKQIVSTGNVAAIDKWFNTGVGHF